MKLLELYEGLFQYVCRLNRAAKVQAQPEYARVRSEVKGLFDEINRNAAADVALLNQAKKLELPLIFFVDNLISTGRLKFASQWAANRLASERNELAGDERFFVDFLDCDLADPGGEAAERLAVYYSCLGLGFTGMYLGQPDQVRRYIEQIHPRIRQWMDNDPHSKISAEAYQHTNTQVLTEPPGNKIIFVAVLFLFLSFCVLAVYYGLYYHASDNLTRSVNQIINQANVAKP